MTKNDIKEITEQLRKLRVEQALLRQQETDLIETLITACGGQDKTNQSRGPQVVPPEDNIKRNKPGQDKFTIGARVRILNPKPRQSGAPLTKGDKQGTIVRKTKFFIFIDTDNELNFKQVRRARTNLALLN